MNTYTAYFRTDASYAAHDIEADTPELALAEARKMADTHAHALWFVPYDEAPINEIVIEDSDDNELASWQDEDLRLRLAAGDLLSAAEKILDRWQNSDIGEVIHELAVAVDAAKGGAHERPQPSQLSGLARWLRRVRRLGHRGVPQSRLRACRAHVARKPFRPLLAGRRHRAYRGPR